MDRSTLDRRTRALIALGACAALIAATIGAAAARADLRPERTSTESVLIALDDERDQDPGFTTSDPEADGPDAVETDEADDADEPEAAETPEAGDEDADEAEAPEATKPKSAAKDDDQGEDADEDRDDDDQGEDAGDDREREHHAERHEERHEDRDEDDGDEHEDDD